MGHLAPSTADGSVVRVSFCELASRPFKLNPYESFRASLLPALYAYSVRGRDEANGTRTTPYEPGGLFPCQSSEKMQFAMIVFACLACFSESLSAAPETIVNKKDLKVARKTAKTSEDHQRIANYYQEQAKKLQV